MLSKFRESVCIRAATDMVNRREAADVSVKLNSPAAAIIISVISEEIKLRTSTAASTGTELAAVESISRDPQQQRTVFCDSDAALQSTQTKCATDSMKYTSFEDLTDISSQRRQGRRHTSSVTSRTLQHRWEWLHRLMRPICP